MNKSDNKEYFNRVMKACWGFLRQPEIGSSIVLLSFICALVVIGGNISPKNTQEKTTVDTKDIKTSIDTVRFYNIMNQVKQR